MSGARAQAGTTHKGYLGGLAYCTVLRPLPGWGGLRTCLIVATFKTYQSAI